MDSVTNYKLYIDKAKELGMTAIAFSEHGNIFEYLHKKEYTEKNGLKYIHAVEAYVTKTLKEKVRDNYHTVLIAKNFDGFKELNYLMSDKVANNREDGHFYYVPRITYDELKNTSDNIIITSSCFSDDADVITTVGVKKIKDVKSGDKVISHTGEICEVNYPTTRYYRGDMINIKAQGMVDTLYSTSNHKFLVEHNGKAVWKEANTLSKGDILLSPINYKSNSIDVLDLTACRNNNTKRRIRRRLKSYNIHITPELLQLIGIYVAEGSLLHNKGGVRFTIGTMYQDRIDFIVENMRDIFGLEPCIGVKQSNGVDIEYSSTEIYNVFSMWFRQGAKHKCVPEFIKKLSPCKQMYFIKGLIMCDGSYRARVDKRNSNWIGYELSFTTISKQLYYEVVNILKRNNINISTYIQPASIDKYGVNRQTAYYLYITSKLAKYVGKFIFGNEEFSKIPLDILLKSQRPRTLNGVVYMPHKINKIEKKYDELHVYCLNVKHNHSFVVNNIAVHNCLGGILNSEDKDLELDFIEFMTKNKHRCFLEIQHHFVDDQIKQNQKLLEVSRSTGIPLIAGTDTHSLNEEYAEGRIILQRAKNTYFDSEEGWDLTFKTYKELLNAYEVQNSIPEEHYLQAIHNTNVLADMVESFTLDRGNKYPKLYDDSEKVFKNKIYEGIKNRNIELDDVKKQRIQHELNTMRNNGSIDYLLLEEDYKSWCRENDIAYGFSRGSVSGSYIAYLLKITEMDSIKHNLIFERFMNPDRVSLCDIDTDLPPSKRDLVKDYIYQKEGLYCADIITFNTIALKGAIRDVGRALEIPLEEVNAISKNVEYKERELRAKYPELFKYVDLLNGVIVSVGTHPAGLVVSPFPLEDTVGTCTLSTTKYPVTQLNMKEIDSLNFVKLDLLGLDNVEIIDETCKLANISSPTPDDIDTNDEKVWDSIRDSALGVFQWESNSAWNYYKELFSDRTIQKIRAYNPNFSYIDLFSMGNGAIRPAGESYRDALASGEHKDNRHKVLNDFLKPTLGYLVFQEQIIEFLNKFCGFSMGEADTVRRGFSKKSGTNQFIPKIKQGFVDTMQENYNVCKKEAERLIVDFIKVIEDASDYLFSLNHSQSYSYIGYTCAWLRYYYPLEFLTALLNVSKDNQDKTTNAFDYINQFTDIQVKPIKFRYSKSEYTLDKSTNTIYKGIASIKYLSSQLGEELYQLRDNHYPTFLELLKDIKEKTSCNTRQLEILIKLDFFKEFGEENLLLKVVELYDWTKRKQVSRKSIKDTPFTEEQFERYSANQTEKTFKEIDFISMIQEVIKDIKPEPTSIKDKAKYQLEYLGYIDLALGVDGKNCYVTDINTRYKPNITVVSLNNNKTLEFKVDKKYFALLKLKKGDIIYIHQAKKIPKWKKVGEHSNGKPKFKPIPGEFNWEIINCERILEEDIYLDRSDENIT